jgi:hypothetical protein
MPLIISDEQFDEALDVMEAALEVICIHEGHEAKKRFTG